MFLGHISKDHGFSLSLSICSEGGKGDAFPRSTFLGVHENSARFCRPEDQETKDPQFELGTGKPFLGSSR